MDQFGLNWADWVLLTLVLLSTLVGAWRGFLGEVLSLAAWVTAFAVALAFGSPLAGRLEGQIEVLSVRMLIAHALLFSVTLIAGGLASWLIRRIVHGTGLSGTDRLLGLLFGIARGVLLGVLLVLMAGFTPFPRDPWWQEARLLPSFQRAAEALAAWLPEIVREHLDFAPSA